MTRRSAQPLRLSSPGTLRRAQVPRCLALVGNIISASTAKMGLLGLPWRDDEEAHGNLLRTSPGAPADVQAAPLTEVGADLQQM